MRAQTLVRMCLLATGCAQGVAASGVTTEEAQPLSAPRGPRVASSTAVSGGTADQRRLLWGILDGLGPTAITRIRIAPAPPQWHPIKDGDVQLDMGILGGAKSFRGEWQSWLVAAAFRDRSAAQGLPRLIVLRTPGVAGRIEQNSSLRDPIPEAAAEAGVQAAAKLAGAKILRLSVAHPDVAVGIDVVLQTDRPAWFAKRRMPIFLGHTVFRYTRMDGMFVELVDGAGRPVLRGANSTRLSTGGSWIRSDLAGCSPFAHPEPVMYDPPPCPVGVAR